VGYGATDLAREQTARGLRLTHPTFRDVKHGSRQFLMACYPWRPPFGPLLRDVENCSWQFLMACHPWQPPCGPLLRNVKNCSRQFFLTLSMRFLIFIDTLHLSLHYVGVSSKHLE
jgi:hypothetical protein